MAGKVGVAKDVVEAVAETSLGRKIIGGVLSGGKKLLGKIAGLGATATVAGVAGSAASGSNDPSQQSGGFADLAGANIAANRVGNGGMGSNNTASAMPVAQGAANSGKNTTVNRNALESSSENMNDVERELVQIKEELKEINAKTVPPDTYQKARNADEGDIKNSFGGGLRGAGKQAAIGGLKGMAGVAALIAGISKLNDTQTEMLDENRDANGRIVNDDGSEVNLNPNSPDVEFDWNASSPAPDWLTNTAEWIAEAGTNALGDMKDMLGLAQVSQSLTPKGGMVTNAINTAGQNIQEARTAATVVGKTGRTTTGLMNTATNMALKQGGNGLDTLGRVYSLTNAPGKVSQVVPKGQVAAAVSRIVAAKAAQGMLKAIPVVGTVFGVGSGLWRAIKGDFLGAGLDLAGAVSSLFPGLGTAGAMTTMSLNLSRDVYEGLYGNLPMEEPDVTDAEGNIIQSGESVAAGRMLDIGTEMTKQLSEWANSLVEGDAAAVPVGDADETITIDGVGDVNIDPVSGIGRDPSTPVIPTSNSSASGGGQMGRSRDLARARQQAELDSQTVAVSDSSAGSGGGAPVIIQAGSGAVAPVVNVSPPVVNIITGDEMRSGAMGSARFANGVV